MRKENGEELIQIRILSVEPIKSITIYGYNLIFLSHMLRKQISNDEADSGIHLKT